MMSGDRLQIGHDPARSASYVNHWVKALRDDPREIYRAAQDAQQISDYVLGRARERDPDRDTLVRQIVTWKFRKSLKQNALHGDPRPTWHYIL